MKVIRYRLHFSLLVAGVFILSTTELVLQSSSISKVLGPFVYYGVMGIIHATAIVMALRDNKPAKPEIAVTFELFATAWSFLTPVLVLWGSKIWDKILNLLPSTDYEGAYIFVLGSFIGAAGYWLIVRLFWINPLRWSDLLITVAMCVAATLLSFVVWHKFFAENADLLFGPLMTAPWWFAFSVSLYWGEARASARKAPQSPAAAIPTCT